MNHKQNSPRARWQVMTRQAYELIDGEKSFKAQISRIFVGEKIVGYVKGEEFIKKIIGSRHILRRPPAICLDIDSVDQAEEAGARIITIIDSEGQCVFQTSIATLRSDGFEINRGFGRQIGLLLPQKEKVHEHSNMQLSFWGPP